MCRTGKESHKALSLVSRPEHSKRQLQVFNFRGIIRRLRRFTQIRGGKQKALLPFPLAPICVHLRNLRIRSGLTLVLLPTLNSVQYLGR